MDDFERSLTDAAPSTVDAYRRDVRSFVEFAERQGLGAPADVDRRHLRRYIAHLGTRDLARSTIARRVAALRRYFRWAYRRGHVATDPSLGLRPPAGSSRLPRVLRQDELDGLLDDERPAELGRPEERRRRFEQRVDARDDLRARAQERAGPRPDAGERDPGGAAGQGLERDEQDAEQREVVLGIRQGGEPRELPREVRVLLGDLRARDLLAHDVGQRVRQPRVGPEAAAHPRRAVRAPPERHRAPSRLRSGSAKRRSRKSSASPGGGGACARASRTGP